MRPLRSQVNSVPAQGWKPRWAYSANSDAFKKILSKLHDPATTVASVVSPEKCPQPVRAFVVEVVGKKRLARALPQLVEFVDP